MFRLVLIGCGATGEKLDDGIVMSGTTTEIYTVKVSGTQTSVGNMTLTSTFTVTKQNE